MAEPHAITRARERYGVELTLADLDAISRAVAAGESIRLARFPNGTTHHAVLWKGTAMIFAIGGNGYVITALPRHKNLSGARRQAA